MTGFTPSALTVIFTKVDYCERASDALKKVAGKTHSDLYQGGLLREAMPGRPVIRQHLTVIFTKVDYCEDKVLGLVALGSLLTVIFTKVDYCESLRFGSLSAAKLSQ